MRAASRRGGFYVYDVRRPRGAPLSGAGSRCIHVANWMRSPTGSSTKPMSIAGVAEAGGRPAPVVDAASASARSTSASRAGRSSRSRRSGPGFTTSESLCDARRASRLRNFEQPSALVDLGAVDPELPDPRARTVSRRTGRHSPGELHLVRYRRALFLPTPRIAECESVSVRRYRRRQPPNLSRLPREQSRHLISVRKDVSPRQCAV